jgi:hypothetical protein
MSNKSQPNTPSRTDSLGDHDRNLKQESRRNRKLRFRKTGLEEASAGQKPAFKPAWKTMVLSRLEGACAI